MVQTTDLFDLNRLQLTLQQKYRQLRAQGCKQGAHNRASILRDAFIIHDVGL